MAALVFLFSFIALIFRSASNFVDKFLDLIKNLLNPTTMLSEQNLLLLSDLLTLYLPWLMLSLLFRLFFWLFKRAKQRKSGVVILLSFFQMFLPDPYAERTIKTVQVQKKKQVKQTDVPKGLEKLSHADSD